MDIFLDKLAFLSSAWLVQKKGLNSVNVVLWEIDKAAFSDKTIVAKCKNNVVCGEWSWWKGKQKW